MDVDARIVRIDSIAISIATEVAIKGHFEVTVHFHQLVPHLDAIISLDGVRGIPTIVARPDERMR